MATYKGIQGYTVQKLATDPTASEAEGQLWYNSTAGKFKISAGGAASWSSGGSLNTAREAITQAGTQTAAIAMGGYGSPASYKTETETYDGTTWTEVNDLNTARSRGTCNVGTQTAALIGAGIAPSTQLLCETWDGTCWTEVGNLNLARHSLGGAGTTTAALAFGGDATPGYTTGETEKWDGTSWTEVNNLNTGRANIAGGGTQIAALGFSGYTGGGASGQEKNTESYDGTSWTEVADLLVGSGWSGGAGTTTAAICYGSYPTPVQKNCEIWDGTSWAATTAMTTARGDIRGTGTAALGLVAGGGPAPQTTVEEYDNAPITVKTVTVS